MILNTDDLKNIIKEHKKWLNGDSECKRANLRDADLRDANLRDAHLSYANLSYADLSGADLSGADLGGAELRGANLRDANLRDADLRDANLRDANLRDANLRDANLSGADLSGADLRDANLSYADLSGADLSGADLRDADLSGAELISNIDFLDAHFERTDEGYIVYKTFGAQYKVPNKWKIEEKSVITETVNFTRTQECGCGINVAPIKWVKNHYKGKIWKCLIRWEWLAGVCCPYNSDGKIRCEKVELLEVVE